MAGLPLKSGADFYNLEAARLRLHNLGADPTEVGAGLIYFNTSTGLNTSQKARLYTGSAWKTIAFSEDLDVAKNEDFLALQRRVDLLSGDVDTDAIISNMKEVSAFLEGFAEDASLMDLLNDKLSLSEGGTIKKPITINSEYAFAITNNATGDWSGIRFRIGGTNKGFLGIGSTGNPIYVPADQSKMYDILTSAGGTITSTSGYMLTLNRMSDSPTLIAFQNNNTLTGFLGIAANGEPLYLNSNASFNTLLHSGNYSNYALPKTGGTIVSSAVSPLCIDTTHASANYITFLSSGIAKSYVGWNPNLGAFLQNENDQFHIINGNAKLNGNTLLHSGNVGDYKAGDSALLDGLAKYEFYRRDMGSIPTSRDIAALDTGCYWVYENLGQSNPVPSPYASLVVFGKSYYSPQMCVVHNASKAWLRGIYNTSDGSSASDWHELAFKDSNVASATYASAASALVDAQDGKSVAYVSGNTFYIGDSIYPTTSTQILGKDIRFRYGANASFGFWLNSSGNVTIGSQDLAGSDVRLHIEDTRESNGYILSARLFSPNLLNGGTSVIIFGKSESNKNRAYIGYTHNSDGSDSNAITFGFYGKDKIVNFLASGNVGIGTSNPTEKLHVVGNLHVTGNIIADGEVSAGGAAEEGGNAGGGGAFHSESIGVGATQTTIAHGLGTDDIVVSIYEKDGVSGRWSIILTDVEIVDANNIIVSFGSATSVEHKVVIMGAVA